MNSRFLSSPGGRLANLALSLAFLVAAYAAFAPAKTDAIHAIALGLPAIIVTFVMAAILSVGEFPWYSLTVVVFVPLAGFCFVFGLPMVTGAGTAVGSVFATMGGFVLLAGTVLGLTTAPVPVSADQPVGHDVRRIATSRTGV